MTKAHENGDNEFVDEARRLAARTGRSVKEILQEMLEASVQARDSRRRRKLAQAQKYVKERNKQKRRGRK